MYDFFKASTNDFDQEYLVNQFDFESNLNEYTGEIIPKKNGTYVKRTSYFGIDLCIKSSNENKFKPRLILEGSLHKYWNSGGLNHNDFSKSSIDEALTRLSKKFHLDLTKCKTNNLECGVNIIPPIDSSTILKGLLLHKGMPFVQPEIIKANYYQCEHTNKYIKAYDKALQAKKHGIQLDSELFRFENKYKKSRIIKKLLSTNSLVIDELTLESLYNPEIFAILKKDLLKTWDEILFFDLTFDQHRLGDKYFLWSNKLYWQKFKNRMSKKRERDKLETYETLYSQNNKNKIRKLILDKINFLEK